MSLLLLFPSEVASGITGSGAVAFDVPLVEGFGTTAAALVVPVFDSGGWVALPPRRLRPVTGTGAIAITVCGLKGRGTVGESARTARLLGFGEFVDEDALVGV
jgi:hypothetical protein